MARSYLKIFPPEEGKAFASFDLFLPANGDETEEYYICYHFVYEDNPSDASLLYGEGPNNPANRRFYRIRTAFLMRRAGEDFTPVFRALQQGEVGLALREEGAGDFCGGFHGDEVLTAVSLTLDGRELPLDRPFFGRFEHFSFSEDSELYRCNTPSMRLARHCQRYTVDGDTLYVSQRVEWIKDARRLSAAYMPMLTAQRLDPQNTTRILSDTVVFYGEDGREIQTFDTTPYGVSNGGKAWDMFCEGLPATAVKVYGKKSGFSAEAGYTVIGDCIPAERRRTSLCVRYLKNAFDNKIYFDIGKGTAPTAGTVWETQVYYRIRYAPSMECDGSKQDDSERIESVKV